MKFAAQQLTKVQMRKISGGTEDPAYTYCCPPDKTTLEVCGDCNQDGKICDDGMVLKYC